MASFTSLLAVNLTVALVARPIAILDYTQYNLRCFSEQLSTEQLFAKLSDAQA